MTKLENGITIPNGMGCLKCGTEHNKEIICCPHCNIWFCSSCYEEHHVLVTADERVNVAYKGVSYGRLNTECIRLQPEVVTN